MPIPETSRDATFELARTWVNDAFAATLRSSDPEMFVLVEELMQDELDREQTLADLQQIRSAFNEEILKVAGVEVDVLRVQLATLQTRHKLS